MNPPDSHVTRAALLASFDELLQPALFRDHGPNGLQVEGRAEARKLVSGVTASLALIDAAIAENADAILVHHGLFWRGQDGRVTGWMKQRLSRLLAKDPADRYPDAAALIQALDALSASPAPAPGRNAAMRASIGP